MKNSKSSKVATFLKYFVSCLLIVLTNSLFAKSTCTMNALPIYWIGGTGSWDDPDHWSKNSGGEPLGEIPNADNSATFDNNSGLTSGSTVTIPTGDFIVNDFFVTSTAAFTLAFDGTSGNIAAMTILQDITLSTNMAVVFNSGSLSHNEWNFAEANIHNITTNGQDMLHVKFLTENAIYNQMDDLTASLLIRHYAGVWNTNSHEVTSAYLYFRDANSSSNPLTKVLNAGTSIINCDEWDSKLTYGSLTVTGTYNIYTQKFTGSPGTEIAPFTFHNINLLEFTDTPPGGTSPIEHNNFVCTYCLVNKITIFDTGLTQFAGRFTVQNSFIVKNVGSTIAFNGGNSYADEVVINGTISVPNIQGCEERTIFTNAYDDYTTIIRSSGTLNISTSILNNIHTQGAANFVASNSILTGSTTGWSEINVPAPLDYIWIGSGTVADWNDPTQWEVSTGGSNGCLPTINDHVNINSQAQSDLRIPSGYTAECNNLIWKNNTGLELTLNGATNSSSKLIIAGDLNLHASAIITPISSYGFYFSSNGETNIKTNNVQLPVVRFIGLNSEWLLKDKLNATEIIFESGTLVTDGNDVETNYWVSSGNDAKHYDFGSSHITVNGEFKLSQFPTSNVTVDAGTSLYECEKLTSSVLNMYDLKLNNTSTYTLSNYPYVMNDLILNTNNIVRTENNIELNNLVFDVDNSKLEIDPNNTFIVNEGIQSNTSAANPGLLHSRIPGTQADITKAVRNLCALGNINFLDINADLPGVFHAPKGIDAGNNSNINFDSGSTSTVLYWIAGSGTWSNLSNWARVSGGCPSIKNPDDSPVVMFDNNGVFPNDGNITVDGPHITNDVKFENYNNAILNIQTSLQMNNLLVDGAYVTLENKTIEVGSTATIQNGSALVIDILNLTVGNLTAQGGIVIVRGGSNLVITD